MTEFQSPYAYLFQKTDTFKSEDGLDIRYVSLKTHLEKARGTVILLNGWTEFIEKYGEPISVILKKGFNVYAMDWRGQGRSSRSLPDPEKGYVRDYSEFVQDLQKFVDTIVDPKAVKPLILMAHSMGGNISTQYLQANPGKMDRAILSCPMFDLPAGSPLKIAFKTLSTLARGVGRGSAYVPGRNGWKEIPFEENMVTSDPDRYEHDLELLRHNKDLRIGGPTYIWLSATLKALKRVQSEKFLKAIELPVMIYSAEKDTIVPPSSHEVASKQMPDCKLVTIPNAKHELLRESDAIQQVYWEEFDVFLKDL